MRFWIDIFFYTCLVALFAVVLFAGKVCAGPSYDLMLPSPRSSPLPDYSRQSALPVPTVRDTPHEYRILKDQGGLVSEYMKRSSTLRGRRVVVDGVCASACLLLLDESSCATRRGVLVWHAVRWRSTMLIDPDATKRVLASYPPRLRSVIASRGGMLPTAQSIPATKVLAPCH